LATVTSTVAAGVTVGWKTRTEAIVATIIAKPRQEVLYFAILTDVTS
jgi:hypothetical protein